MLSHLVQPPFPLENSLPPDFLPEFLMSGAILATQQWVLLGRGNLSGLKVDWWVQDFWGESPGSHFEMPSQLVDREYFLNYLATNASHYPEDLPKDRVWVEPMPQEFAVALAKFQSQDQIKKVVPVIPARSRGDFTVGEIFRILQTGLAKQVEPLVIYGSWANGAGMLGASPEWLYRRVGNSLTTAAVAGTQSKLEPLRLLESPKDLAEHKFVVKDICDQLQDFGGQIQASSPKLKELPLLWHLQTEIVAHVNSFVQDQQLIKALHPTAALGAYPRAGLDLLKDLDSLTWPEGRGRFGAPFGYILNNRAEILVCIRGIEWRGRDVFLGSGCGLVRESHFEQEWAELQLKRKSVKDFWGWK